MTGRQMSGALAAIALLMAGSGCTFGKKKSPNIPQQAQAPTIIRQPVTTTQPGPPPPATSEPSRPLPTPGEVATEIPPEPQPVKKQHVARKIVPPKKTVVENTPVTAPVPAQPPAQQQGQVTASVSQNDALHQRVDTQQLLDSTEATLRGLNRSLSEDEQAVVAHIRSYIQQSKNASSDGDLERAYNLAVKAHLLSDGLVKK
jgi:outer membrane biosynthesis protein TonB